MKLKLTPILMVCLAVLTTTTAYAAEYSDIAGHVPHTVCISTYCPLPFVFQGHPKEPAHVLYVLSRYVLNG